MSWKSLARVLLQLARRGFVQLSGLADRPRSRARMEALLHKYLAGEDIATGLSFLEPTVLLARMRFASPRLPIGASRLGGVPDLPPGTEWPHLQRGNDPPEPFLFVAQIDLSEAPPGFGLPETGWLWFFQAASPAGLSDSEPDSGVRVLHSTTERASLVRTATPAATAEQEYPLCRVRPKSHWVLNDRFGLDSDERSDHDSLDMKLDDGPRKHHLRGSPESWCGDLGQRCVDTQQEIIRLRRVITGNDEIPPCPDTAEDWTLLLQLEIGRPWIGVLHWLRADFGLVHWMIHRDDLAVGRFDRVMRFVSSS